MKTKLPYKHNKKYVIYRKGKIFSKVTNQYLTGTKNQMGDPVVNISQGRRQTEGSGTLMIKHLVASHFLPNQENHSSVININHNKTDCRASNLKWVSRSTAIAHNRKKKRTARQPKRTDEQRLNKSIQTAGTSHYKFKGHYSKAGALYVTIKEAAADTGETAYAIKRDSDTNQNGWSFIPFHDTSSESGTQTFIEEESHPEQIFQD